MRSHWLKNKGRGKMKDGETEKEGKEDEEERRKRRRRMWRRRRLTCVRAGKK